MTTANADAKSLRVMQAIFDAHAAKMRYLAQPTPANKRLMEEAERRMENAKKEAIK